MKTNINIFKNVLAAISLVSISSVYAETKEEKSIREFAGISFGVGISLTHDLGSRNRVNSAILDENGVVRVTSESNEIARVMLESHYFFEPKSDDVEFLWTVPGNEWGHGPFIALQPGTDEVIDAIGLGWMVGFRRDDESGSSWNLGLGYIVDPSVQVFADGITENNVLQESETNIRFKETSQGGLFLLVSFNY